MPVFILCWHTSGTMMWRCMWLWRTPKEPQCCSLGSSSCSCRTWTSSPTTSASPWSCTITMTVSVLDQVCWNSYMSEWTHLPLLFSHPSGLPTPRIQGGWMWQPLVWGHCSALQGGRGTDGLSYLENSCVSRRRSAEEAAGGKTFEWGDTGFPERSSVKQKERSRIINQRYTFYCGWKKAKDWCSSLLLTSFPVKSGLQGLCKKTCDDEKLPSEDGTFFLATLK